MNTKNTNQKVSDYQKELVEMLLVISKDKKLFSELLDDIFTPAEFKSIAIRWQIVLRLSKGESHRSIAKSLGLGIGTVTRGAKELKDQHGAFAKILKKTQK